MHESPETLEALHVQEVREELRVVERVEQQQEELLHAAGQQQKHGQARSRD